MPEIVFASLGQTIDSAILATGSGKGDARMLAAVVASDYIGKTYHNC